MDSKSTNQQTFLPIDSAKPDWCAECNAKRLIFCLVEPMSSAAIGSLSSVKLYYCALGHAQPQPVQPKTQVVIKSKEAPGTNNDKSDTEEVTSDLSGLF